MQDFDREVFWHKEGDTEFSGNDDRPLELNVTESVKELKALIGSGTSSRGECVDKRSAIIAHLERLAREVDDLVKDNDACESRIAHLEWCMYLGYSILLDSRTIHFWVFQFGKLCKVLGFQIVHMVVWFTHQKITYNSQFSD